MNEGIFTQPGPDGILGRGGAPNDATAPAIDSDGVNLRATLVAVVQSPGHIRVARAIKHPNGQVEFQEEYREPTAEEHELLARQGVKVGPGMLVQSGDGVSGLGSAIPDPNATAASGGVMDKLKPVLKVGALLAVGAGLFWAGKKWGVPMVTGGGKKAEDDDDEDDGDDDEDGDDA